MRTRKIHELFCSSTLALLVCAGTWLPAQAGTGAPYGARDPQTCTADNSKTLTVDEARKLFMCFNEVVTGDYLYLIEGLNMTLGAPRKIIPTTDTYDAIDADAPVYPIRGSFTRYQCSRQYNIDASHTNVGTNCNAYPQPRAEGICYKTKFGDWSCKMFDHVTDSYSAKMHVPPPK